MGQHQIDQKGSLPWNRRGSCSFRAAPNRWDRRTTRCRHRQFCSRLRNRGFRRSLDPWQKNTHRHRTFLCSVKPNGNGHRKTKQPTEQVWKKQRRAKATYKKGYIHEKSKSKSDWNVCDWPWISGVVRCKLKVAR